MKKTIKIVWKTMKWGFIVFCIYLGTLFFREQRISGAFVESLVGRLLPKGLVLHVDSADFGFRSGLRIHGLRLYDMDKANPVEAVVSADVLSVNPLARRMFARGLTYRRLPDSYYLPGNFDRNRRVEAEFPALGSFDVTLVSPDILAVRPDRLTCVVTVAPHRIDFERIHLDWPDLDVRMALDGFTYVDLDRQEVYGEVKGLARHDGHIRPLIVAVDVPVALPYMDGFTEVPEPCPAWCAWKVDLVNNDFDLWLDLHPVLGKYKGVSFRKGDGKIHLHNCTRQNCLNYVTTVGPIAATDVEGRALDGRVVIVGTNGMNTVTVEAKSALPLANVLRVGGFTGDYVGNDVFGDSECRLEFRFPRVMTNNYELLNGKGHVSIRNGQLMRMKGFRGLIEVMPSVAPAITWFTDSTQASADYVIEKGVVRTDNVYIEGTFFSIKMYGWFDSVRNVQDFRVRVQFAKKDSLVGRILHPLAWPFTKLLLEFRLTGSPENPKWEYLSVIDRVLEVVQ